MRDLAAWAVAVPFFVFVLLSWGGVFDKETKSVPNVDLTEAEMRLILTRIVAAESHGIATPEDQSVKQKLIQMVGLLTPRSQEDMVRSYTDPTARR